MDGHHGLLTVFAFLFFLYAPFATAIEEVECGTNKSLGWPTGRITDDARIMNCSTLAGSSVRTTRNVTWNLVAQRYSRSFQRFVRVWKDSVRDTVWADELPKKYILDDVINYYLDGMVFGEKLCTSQTGRHAAAGVGEEFRLPTYSDILEAELDGIREIYPRMRQSDYYWTSTFSAPTDFVYAFRGRTAMTESISKTLESSVQCLRAD